MSEVRLFTIRVPEQKLQLIAAQLTAAQIGYAPDDDGDWRYGTDAGYLRAFVEYWRDRYDWRAAEAKLNQHPQFLTHIDGIDVHFHHVKSPAKDAFPIILTHGWPGSIIEFQNVIGPLTAAGFDVVVPTLPGYGFGQRPPRPSSPAQIANMWRTLMVERLGYKRFGAQGGDWGSAVTMSLGRHHADVVAAVHLNLIIAPPPSGEDDAATLAHRETFQQMLAAQSAYMMVQMTKPQTIGLALAASPVAFAAWVLEKFQGWTGPGTDLDATFGKDDLITNLMIYLVNDAVQSGIWLYRSVLTQEPFQRIAVPTGIAEFPQEFYPYPPRSAADRAFNITRWTKMPAGGHFAAMQEPEAFSREVATFFSSHRG